MDDLSRRLAELGALGAGEDLNSLERDVWARIDARKLRPMPRELAAVLCACVGFATSFAGVATAAAASRVPSPFSAFDLEARMAPSTVLGD